MPDVANNVALDTDTRTGVAALNLSKPDYSSAGRRETSGQGGQWCGHRGLRGESLEPVRAATRGAADEKREQCRERTVTAEIPTDTDALDAMLQDPEVRESLAVILANAPALAALASMSSALLQRGPELTDNINDLVRQLRETSEDSHQVANVRDAVKSLSELAPLTSTLAERKDTIQGFLDSPILRPEIIDVVGNLGEAALEADRQTRGRQVDSGGVFALVRQLKNSDVQETLSFLLAFAKVFGSRQRSG
jgi:hypothetical protein